MIEWRDVVGYEDLFMISSCGRIFSKRTNKELKQYLNPKGYYVVATKIGGRSGQPKCFRIHRLVAEAFIQNQDNKPCVNHIDGCKTNNDVKNLEWVTHSENTIHALANGLIDPLKQDGTNSTQSVLTEDDVVSIRARYVSGSRSNGARAIAREYGVCHNTVLDVVNGRSYKSVK